MKTAIKHPSLLSLLLAAAMATTASAASWRVNNSSKMHAHFTSINAAMSSDDVVDGDTLYLDPGCLLTANQTVTKQVTIIGTGYFLDAAVHQVANVTGNLYLKAPYTKVEGLSLNTVYIQAYNSTVERCKTAIIYVSAQYATIRQCYSTRVKGEGSTSTQSAYATIENCIIQYAASYGPLNYLFCPTIRNNYLRSNNSDTSVIRDVSGGIITNNIIVNITAPNNMFYVCGDLKVTNNVMSCASYDDNICLGSKDEKLIFACSGANDAYFQLADDSPARGAALDGGDCGPFGGLYPYVLSGYPLGMPHFTSNSIGSRAHDGQVIVNQQVSIQNQ